MEYNTYVDPSLERKLWIRDAANRVSRIFLALFVYEIISYALVYAVTLVMAIINPSLYLEVAESPIFNMLLSSFSMYLVAFPVLYLMVRKMRVHRFEKKKLEAGEMVLAFCIAETLGLIGSYISNILTTTFTAVTGIVPEDGTSDLIAETPIWLLAIIVVVIGPIVEELIFRKLIIDRLSVHGELFAIILSSVAFGIFHQNI